MTKKTIKRVAIQSFTRSQLDARKVQNVARLLKRSELKEYIRALKAIETSKKVKIYIPNIDRVKRADLQKTFGKIFPNKKILYEEDPSLILGVKVINNDLVYEFSLRGSFEDMENFLENQYE